MSSTQLIAENWYLAFNRTWPPAPLDDQYLAGGIMWGSGDVIALVMLIALFVQWVRLQPTGGAARGPPARPAGAVATTSGCDTGCHWR
jgi:cytochrome c oxidase assembly factor CtaG